MGRARGRAPREADRTSAALLPVSPRLQKATQITQERNRAELPMRHGVESKLPIYHHTSQPAMMGLEQRQRPSSSGLPVTGRQILHTPSMPQPDLVGINSRIHALLHGLWHWGALALEQANSPSKSPAHALDFDLSAVYVAFAHVSKALLAKGSQSLVDGRPSRLIDGPQQRTR